MWDLKACRGCLTTKGRLERIGEGSKRLYSSITGIEIKDGDGYPTYFCMECHRFIRKVFTFRRKFRRAHFVLKEIVIVRKQATLNNILSVNRKRTNLESSLGKWKLQNNAFYHIDNTESDIDTVDREISMVQYKPTVNFTSIYHIVDIEPPGLPETVQIQEELEKVTDYHCTDFDTQENEPSMDIDLDDVFKDLKDDEDVETSDFEFVEKYEELDSEPVKIKEKKESKAVIKESERISMKQTAKALCNVNIKKLTIEEQRDILVKRLRQDHFRSALYKCSICLYIFDSMNVLMEHVRAHNSSTDAHLCVVCKNRFKSELELESHINKIHLYLYHCKTCDRELYTLYQVEQHYVTNHFDELPKRKPRNKTAELFDVILLPQEEMCVKNSEKNTDLQCSYCGASFYKRKEYSAHMNSHKTPPPNHFLYQCDICRTWHKTRTQMEKHMTECHMYNYHCKRCKSVYHNLNETKQDKCEMNKQCQSCKKKFKSYPGLYSHRYDCQYSYLHLHHCVICGYSVSTEYNLYLHQLSEHQYFSIKEPAILGSEFSCLKCNVQFLSKRAYQFHALRHNHPEAKNIQNSCFLCRKLFDTDEDYQSHQTVCKHARKFPRKCQYCEDVLTSRIEYNQHLTAFHPSMEDMSLAKLRLCHLCGKTVRRQFSVHMRAHSMRKSFDCTQCTPVARFPNANCYVAHVLSAHAHRPYSCAICGITFQMRNDCRDHILKIHSPVFPYKCIICEQMFSHSNFLLSHLKKAHRIITDKDPKLKLAPIRFKVVTYPHMRINLSTIDKNILDMINIELTDYLHEKTEILNDYSNYVILDPSYKQDDVTETLVKPKKRIKSQSKDNVPKKKRHTADSQTLAVNSIKEKVVEEMVIPQNELIIEDNTGIGTLPVIEHEGERYVIINDVTYKIEND